MYPTRPGHNELPATTTPQRSSLDELDDLLAEMSTGAAGGGANRDGAPRGEAPPPVVPHGIAPEGRLFARFGPDQVRAVIEDSLDSGIVGAARRARRARPRRHRAGRGRPGGQPPLRRGRRGQ